MPLPLNNSIAAFTVLSYCLPTIIPAIILCKDMLLKCYRRRVIFVFMSYEKRTTLNYYMTTIIVHNVNVYVVFLQFIYSYFPYRKNYGKSPLRKKESMWAEHHKLLDETHSSEQPNYTGTTFWFHRKRLLSKLRPGAKSKVEVKKKNEMNNFFRWLFLQQTIHYSYSNVLPYTHITFTYYLCIYVVEKDFSAISLSYLCVVNPTKWKK